MRSNLHLLGYISLGCWKDKSKSYGKDTYRAIPGFRGYIKVNGSYINGCHQKAQSLGNSIFALQNDRECWTSKEGEVTYNKYGKSKKCVLGHGAIHANSVYKIKGIQ